MIDNLVFTMPDIATICLFIAELILGALIIGLLLIWIWRHYKTFGMRSGQGYSQRQSPANEINEDMIVRIKLQYFEVQIAVALIIIIIFMYLLYLIIIA